jgi:hypothetical protein
MGEVLADVIVRGVRAVIRDAVETLHIRALTPKLQYHTGDK